MMKHKTIGAGWLSYAANVVRSGSRPATGRDPELCALLDFWAGASFALRRVFDVLSIEDDEARAADLRALAIEVQSFERWLRSEGEYAAAANDATELDPKGPV